MEVLLNLTVVTLNDSVLNLYIWTFFSENLIFRTEEF